MQKKSTFLLLLLVIACGPLMLLHVMADRRNQNGIRSSIVDDDRMIPLPPGGKESISAATAVHVGTLSTGSAGAGYTPFVQQRRREAEERRDVDKKLDARS
ncbi:hypothetical protein MLD38_010088 [Melastoma candidum]|uniref:Uncharacterized protein n=1 Tax=Melastoma candidum TaxID=119954 RepID=A0ACB9R298_9MYRT|nr:hypothetical protein MLD38_010088 [Melastoma candidum]